MVDTAALVSVGGSASRQLYVVIKERLLDGTYLPGHRMPIDELTVEFGVSKQPVRDAFRILAADGLLEIKPQAGTRVTRYSPSEMVVFYQVLAGFEGAASQAAAVNRTDAQVERARTLLIASDAASDQGRNAASLRRSNREFHNRVHEMAHSRLITLQSQRMWDLSTFLLSAFPRQDSVDLRAGRQHSDHWDLLEAIADRDQERAGALMTAHVRQIGDIAREL